NDIPRYTGSMQLVVADLPGISQKIAWAYSPSTVRSFIYRVQVLLRVVNLRHAIVNFTMEFINIVTGWPGSAHDSRMFKMGMLSSFDISRIPS
ncbi:hypothetical protein L9F63_014797, partial [Diploptera punctata]